MNAYPHGARAAGWSSPLIVAALVVGGVTAAAQTARAALEPCVNVVKELTCEPMPDGGEARRAMLLSLDASARQAVADNQRRAAARFFGCLLLADPRPENAGNLAVVLKQSGDLPAALDAAMCAERLAVPDSANAARARARRMEIEHLLSQMQPPPLVATGTPVVAIPSASSSPSQERLPSASSTEAPPVAAAPPSPQPSPAAPRSLPKAVLALATPTIGREAPAALPIAAFASPSSSVTSPPPSGASWRRQGGDTTDSPSPSTRHLTPAVVGSGVAAVLGSGLGAVSYFLAHARAEQFRQEQSSNGFTPRAMELKHGAEMWQVTSLAGFLVAGAATATVVVLW